ncbi:MAG: uncharacterized protein KVP18_003824 [Porospora cf. gigantea A]|uniref:uncharacterized protein n=1 Tax=Porospora cf. gigantea A TaxID=2853593 RepID=UPI003559D298|nr:MAG: hypothetical protein KVP18_003824 [Porospora cf. gigantea A]
MSLSERDIAESVLAGDKIQQAPKGPKAPKVPKVPRPRRSRNEPPQQEKPIQRTDVKEADVRKVSAGTTFSDLQYVDVPSVAEPSTQCLNSRLVQKLDSLGFGKLTHIQSQAIPWILAHGEHDVFVRSPTGSGKTLAFAAPAVERIHRLKMGNPALNREDGTMVLVVSPTRELASQTGATFDRITGHMKGYTVTSTVAGLVKKNAEKAWLRKGSTIVTGTVGRLLDHLDSTHSWSFKNLQCVILDEADRIVELGYEAKLKKLHEFLRAKQENFQNVMVSATLSPAVESIARLLLRQDPIWVVGGAGFADTEETTPQELQDYSVPSAVEQIYVPIASARTKLSLLIALLIDRVQVKKQKALVFAESCDMVDYFHSLFITLRWPNEAAVRGTVTTADMEVKRLNERSNNLIRKYLNDGADSDSDSDDLATKDNKKNKRHGNPVDGLLGDLVFSQPDRLFKLHGKQTKEDRVGYLQNFQEEPDSCVIFTTDVAARGLNLQDVNVVIQFDAPKLVEDYVHRAGRTGRLNAKGESILMLLPNEVPYATEYLPSKGVVLSVKKENEALNVFSDESCLPASMRSCKNPLPILQAFWSRLVAHDEELLWKARKAYVSSTRAINSREKHVKHLFNKNNAHFGEWASGFFLRESPKFAVYAVRFDHAKKAERGEVQVEGRLNLAGLPEKQFKKAKRDQWKRQQDSNTRSPKRLRISRVGSREG